MLSVMELPRNQQDVRPLPGSKYSKTGLNKSLKGNISTSSKVVPPRTGLQSIGRSKGTRLLSSLVKAPNFVEIPSIRAETAMSDHDGPGSGNAGWVPNTNAEKTSESRQSSSVNLTGAESSKNESRVWSSLMVNSGYPTAAEAAKSGSGTPSHGESSNTAHDTWSDSARRKSDVLATELDSAWADAGDEEMDFSHPPVFDDEDEMHNISTEPSPKSNERQNSDQSLEVQPSPASSPEALSSTSQNIVLSKGKQANAPETKTFYERTAPPAQPVWKFVSNEPRSTSRFRDKFPDPRHLSSQPKREIPNWRQRDPHHFQSSSFASSTYLNNNTRYNHDERHRDERNKYFESHPPQLLQRPPSSSRAPEHGDHTGHHYVQDSHKSVTLDDTHQDTSNHVSSVIGHQDVRGLSDVRVEMRRPRPADASTNMPSQDNSGTHHLLTERIDYNSTPRDTAIGKPSRHLYEPAPSRSIYQTETRNRQPSDESRHNPLLNQLSSSPWGQHDSNPERKAFGEGERVVQILKHDSTSTTPASSIAHNYDTASKGSAGIADIASTVSTVDSTAIPRHPSAVDQYPRRVLSDGNGRRGEYAEKHRQKWMERNTPSFDAREGKSAASAQSECLAGNSNSQNLGNNCSKDVKAATFGLPVPSNQKHSVESVTLKPLFSSTPSISTSQGLLKRTKDIDICLQRLKGLQDSMKSDATLPPSESAKAPTKNDEAHQIGASTRNIGTVRPIVLPKNIETVKPVTPTKDVETVKPVGPTKEMEAVKPIVPTKDIEAVKPIVPTESIGTFKPVGSTKETGTAKPVGPTKNIQALKPVAPMKNTQALKSLAPMKDIQALQPLAPMKDIQALQPLTPAKNLETTQPLLPTKSLEASQPETPQIPTSALNKSFTQIPGTSKCKEGSLQLVSQTGSVSKGTVAYIEERESTRSSQLPSKLSVTMVQEPAKLNVTMVKEFKNLPSKLNVKMTVRRTLGSGQT